MPGSIRPSSSRRRLLVFLALTSPGLLCLGFFFFAPLARMAMISFLRYSPTDIWRDEFTFENYARFLSHYYLRAAATTVVVALSVTCACIVLGYPFAYFLARIPARRLGPYMFVLISPLMMSSVVLVLGWVILLGPNGPVIALLSAFGLAPTKLLYNKPAIVLGLTELLLPFMVLPLISAIENIHPSLEEAAQNLGASGMQTFYRVILPMSRPGLVSGSLLVFSMALGSLVVPALLGGPADAMVGNVIYEEVMSSLNWPFASAIALMLLVVTSVTMTIYLRASRRIGRRQVGMA
jgi:ABC-type spermidine/putrescine transport system permease subunit I